MCRAASTPPCGVGTWFGVSRACCTLLGPEGPGRTFWVCLVSCRTLSVVLLWMVVGYRPYIENYTVDASILDSPVFRWITKIYL